VLTPRIRLLSEVVLAENEPPEAGISEANNLMIALEVSPDNLVNDAYIDLLARQST
jgi:hypothetical protein